MKEFFTKERPRKLELGTEVWLPDGSVPNKRFYGLLIGLATLTATLAFRKMRKTLF